MNRVLDQAMQGGLISNCLTPKRRSYLLLLEMREEGERKRKGKDWDPGYTKQWLGSGKGKEVGAGNQQRVSGHSTPRSRRDGALGMVCRLRRLSIRWGGNDR